MNPTSQPTPEARATKRVKTRTDVLWHIATYAIINAFLWLIGDAGPDNRRYHEYLDEERAQREQQPR